MRRRLRCRHQVRDVFFAYSHIEFPGLLAAPLRLGFQVPPP